MINDLLLEFLLTEGFVRSAELFREEANIAFDESAVEGVLQRNQIRNAVLTKNIEQAMELTDEISPEILANNPKLLFRLRKHILIRHIRNDNIGEAINFAQTMLAPLVEEGDDALRQDLEQVLALLIFDNIDSSPVAHVLHAGEVSETARMLNAAILRFEGRDDEARLLKLLQETQWAQDQLGETGLDFPPVIRTPNL